MNTGFNNQKLDKTFKQDEGLDLKKIVSKFVSHWYLFLLGIFICTSLAFLVILYVTPTYKISSAITVEDNSSDAVGKSLVSSSVDFSDLLGTTSNAYNEIDILKSKYLLTQVVTDLKLNVIIYQKNKLTSTELYDEAPFDVRVVEKKDSIEKRKFNINIINNKVHVTNSYEHIDTVVNFNKTLSTDQFDLFFVKKPKNIDPYGYKITVESVDSKVDELSKNFDVDLTDKKSTTLALTFDYSNSKKGEVILQKLMDLYLNYNLENKKKIADTTLAFIDNRLKIVATDLSGIETEFSKFKQKNNIYDVVEQSKALVTDVSDYNNKLNDQEVQLSILNDISKYLNNPANKRIIPSSLAVHDPVFAAAVGKYNELLVERDQLSISYKDDNPIIQNLDEQIETARQGLLQSFNSYRKQLVIGINSLKSTNSALLGQVKQVPDKEKTFLDYSRKQNLQQELYLYLLQKHEETAISKTSTLSTARIIDPAKADYLPYRPNKLLVYLLGITFGLLLPWAYLYIKEALNVRILSKEDIEANSNVTILGEIGNNPDAVSFVITSGRSIISEQFRALRTNLQFLAKANKSAVIMITSSMSGEGKSFISANLAGVLAMVNKRVVLLELDLRKPKLSNYLGMDNTFGFTNYVISDNIDEEGLVKPTFFSENCFLISSGPIPPNPSELLMSDRLGTLMTYLKKNFDYIIIDSAPIGLVSDAQLLEEYVDVNLYVVREGHTYKSQLNIVNDLVAQKKIKRTYLIVNDITTKRGGYYGYGYGYNGYANYSEETVERKWWQIKKS